MSTLRASEPSNDRHAVSTVTREHEQALAPLFLSDRPPNAQPSFHLPCACNRRVAKNGVANHPVGPKASFDLSTHRSAMRSAEQPSAVLPYRPTALHADHSNNASPVRFALPKINQPFDSTRRSSNVRVSTTLCPQTSCGSAGSYLNSPIWTAVLIGSRGAFLCPSMPPGI